MTPQTKGLENIYQDIVHLRGKRLFNRCLNYTFAVFKFTNFVPEPVSIQIEPSAICNLHCRMCNLDKSHDQDRFLTPEKFSKLLDHLKSVNTINFTGMGECLLNPNLSAIIKLAKDRHIDSTIITNGQLLNSAMIKQLVSLDLKNIIISMESGSPRDYENIRLGARYSVLEKNLSSLSKLMKLHSPQTQLYINVVLLPFNLKHLRHLYKIIDLAVKNNIKNVSFQLPHHFAKSGLKKYYLPSNQGIIHKFKLIKKYSNSKNIRIFLPSTKIIPSSCYYPWAYPQITASGHLLPCCVISQFDLYSKIISQYSWGNVFDTPFESLWNGLKAQNFRRQLNSDPNVICRNCTKYQGIL